MGRIIDRLQELDGRTLPGTGGQRGPAVVIALGCLFLVFGVVELVTDLGRSPFLTLLVGVVLIATGIRHRRTAARAGKAG